jgi:hypothetical protein
MIGSEVVEAFCQSECDPELGNATFAIDAADNALRAACNEHGVPSSNDRNLRSPDGWSRRKPVIEDRDGGGCGWGKAVVRVERYRMGRLAMLSHRLRRPRPSARVPDDIDGEDRCEAAGRGHCSGTPALRMPA